MKHSAVVVHWKEGLQLRRATHLVKLAQNFRSRLILKCRGKTADLRSIFSVITLCATVGSAIDVIADGDDERDALAAVEHVFSPDQISKSNAEKLAS